MYKKNDRSNWFRAKTGKIIRFTSD